MHQAVSGGSCKVFETLLQFGILLDEMNSRKHQIEDLATDPGIQALIRQYRGTKKDPLTNKKFEVGEIKYFCAISRKFYKKESVKHYWIYEDHTSMDREKLECRSTKC